MFPQVLSGLCSVFFSVSVDMICFLGGLVKIGLGLFALVRSRYRFYFDLVCSGVIWLGLVLSGLV